jgi:hypothetical protein
MMVIANAAQNAIVDVAVMILHHRYRRLVRNIVIDVEQKTGKDCEIRIHQQ